MRLDKPKQPALEVHIGDTKNLEKGEGVDEVQVKVMSNATVTALNQTVVDVSLGNISSGNTSFEEVNTTSIEEDAPSSELSTQLQHALQGKNVSNETTIEETMQSKVNKLRSDSSSYTNILQNTL